MLDISKEHGGSGSHSGVSTPFSGTQTPHADDATTIAPSSLGSSTTGDVKILSEKLSRRKSFGTAALAVTPAIRASSSGLSQEHIEQGRVKRTVYLRYLEAASKLGFSACHNKWYLSSQTLLCVTWESTTENLETTLGCFIICWVTACFL